MAARQPLTADDLRACVDYAGTALDGVTDAQWDGKPSGSEWDRRRIMRHVTWAVLAYGSLLATRADGPIDFILVAERDDPTVYTVNRMRIASELLIGVTQGVEPTVRAWHPRGRPDSEGYLALAASEVLLHVYDVVKDLGIEFDPDPDVVNRVVQRYFPWAPHDTPPWPTMLWASNRGDLPGHEPIGPDWWSFPSPLEEWDGQLKKRPVDAKLPDIGRPIYTQL